MVTLKSLNKKRILAISDIHGELDKFLQLLKIANYNPDEDQLVICGDLADRGNQNIDSICTAAYLQSQGTIITKGNHDLLCHNTIAEMLNGKIGSHTRYHIQCGGFETVEEFKNASKDELTGMFNFLYKLPLYYEIDNYIFVHGGFDTSIPLEQNVADTILWLWDSNQFFYSPGYKDKIIIFGHNVTYTMPHLLPKNGVVNRNDIKIWIDEQHNGDKIGIDCGSIFGGKLACLELPSKKVFYL